MGDFIIIDMSDPDPSRRSVYVVELKMNAALSINESRNHVQIRNYPAGLQEIVDHTAAITTNADATVLFGDNDVVLGFLSGNAPRSK